MVKINISILLFLIFASCSSNLPSEKVKAEISILTQQVLAESDSSTITCTDLDCRESYSMYYQNVRKEYAIYSDFLYNPGRIKVLNHFLTMDRIFKTDHFSNRFEARAKQNLLQEIEVLKG